MSVWADSASTAGQRELFPAIVIGGGIGESAAADAIALAGGRVVATIDWSAVPGAIGRHACTPVFVVEGAGASDEELLAALPRIDAVARALDLPLVASCEEAQIDVMCAGLLKADVHWLCAPSLAERVAALALAAEDRADTTCHDSVREGEAARLQRLNEEVARIAEVLARLTQRDETPQAAHAAAVFDRSQGFAAGEDHDAAPIEPAEIRQVIRARRLRDQFFGAGLFEDPAWDMLLDLLAADLERIRVSVSSLCIASAVAPTTALRWIGKLVDAGLLVRQPDPFDRRRAYMELTDQARAGLKRYVGAVKRAGLTLV